MDGVDMWGRKSRVVVEAMCFSMLLFCFFLLLLLLLFLFDCGYVIIIFLNICIILGVLITLPCCWSCYCCYCLCLDGGSVVKDVDTSYLRGFLCCTPFCGEEGRTEKKK